MMVFGYLKTCPVHYLRWNVDFINRLLCLSFVLLDGESCNKEGKATLDCMECAQQSGTEATIWREGWGETGEPAEIKMGKTLGKDNWHLLEELLQWHDILGTQIRKEKLGHFAICHAKHFSTFLLLCKTYLSF